MLPVMQEAWKASKKQMAELTQAKWHGEFKRVTIAPGYCLAGARRAASAASASVARASVAVA